MKFVFKNTILNPVGLHNFNIQNKHQLYCVIVVLREV